MFGVSMDSLWPPDQRLIASFWIPASEGPEGFWREIQKFPVLLQNPTIWVSMNSLGPQLLGFDIFELTQPLKGPKNTEGLLVGNSEIPSF